MHNDVPNNLNANDAFLFDDFTAEYEGLIEEPENDANALEEDPNFDESGFVRTEDDSIDIKKTIMSFQEHFESFVKDFSNEGETSQKSSDEDFSHNEPYKVVEHLTTEQVKFQEIIERARLDAQLESSQIIKNAQDEAESIRQQAFEEGYNDGVKQGYGQALTEYSTILKEKSDIALAKIQKDVDEIAKSRDKVVSEYLVDLRDLTIAIAEKIINVSLKSSGTIIEKMIIAATEKSKNATWAKLYISQVDWDFAIKSDAQVLNAIKRVTDTVKIEILDNDERGTCIIEFPDRIIDASVSTQLEKVKSLLQNISE